MKQFLILIGCVVGLFLFYITIRILAYGIFRSFFDAKKYFIGGINDAKKLEEKNGRELDSKDA